MGSHISVILLGCFLELGRVRPVTVPANEPLQAEVALHAVGGLPSGTPGPRPHQAAPTLWHLSSYSQGRLSQRPFCYAQEAASLLS